jgi:radical SAM-linked protein
MGVKFAKTGPAAYISHLDLQRAFSRAIRRAGLPVALSQGFNPHYVVSFASALALGTESTCECVEMALDQDIAPDVFMERLGRAMPPGLAIIDVRRLCQGAPKMMAVMCAAEYTVSLHDADLGKINQAVCDIIESREVFAEKVSKRKAKTIDIRPMILTLDVKDGGLVMRLASGPSGSLKPELVLHEIQKRAGVFACRILRTQLLTIQRDKAVDILTALSES